jgi:hypothetical protein
MSDQDTSLFNQAIQSAQQGKVDQTQNQQQQVDINAAFADQLAVIKNEEGAPKYKTVEDALKALQNSQSHIQTLEQENSTLRETASKAKSTEEILGILNSSKNKQSDDNQQQIDVESIKALVNTTLSERQQQELQRTNQQKVTAALINKFGDKAEEMYKKKADELSLSLATLDNLAAVSPAAVLEYFSAKEQSIAKNNKSSINTDILGHSQQRSQTKSIMYGSSNADMVNAWRVAVDSVGQQ